MNLQLKKRFTSANRNQTMQQRTVPIQKPEFMSPTPSEVPPCMIDSGDFFLSRPVSSKTIGQRNAGGSGKQSRYLRKDIKRLEKAELMLNSQPHSSLGNTTNKSSMKFNRTHKALIQRSLKDFNDKRSRAAVAQIAYSDVGVEISTPKNGLLRSR